MESVIDSFITKTKQGPDFVCSSCHRLMYQQTVMPLNIEKYTKASSTILLDVFRNLYTCFDGNTWVCTTCNAALARGNMPKQALANGLKLPQIPPELSSLNALELRLISLRLPFMKMVALPSGKQRCIHGPAVNVPSKLDCVCTVLPRLPSQSELIPLKLKRKLVYKGHYMYDYVNPQKILKALRWLKLHNPLYVDIDINEEWVFSAKTDDGDLLSGLMNLSMPSDVEIPIVTVLNNSLSSDPVPTEVPTNSSEFSPQDKCDCDGMDSSQNAINDSESIDDPLVTATRDLETYAINNQFTVHDVPGDGNCLYSSVLYQLQANGLLTTTAQNLREMVAVYLSQHAETYMPFVCSPVQSGAAYNHDTEAPDSTDEYIAYVNDLSTQSMLRWLRYLERLINGAWGDQVVIAALANMFNVILMLFMSDMVCVLWLQPPLWTIWLPVNSTLACIYNTILLA